MGQHLVHRLSEYYDTCGLGSSSYDLTDDEDSSAMFARHEADVAIHAAALCRGIGAQRPVDMLAENLKMSMNFLRGARLAEVPKVILISSVCAYPKNAVIPFKEDDLWNGYPEETNGGYGVAKRVLVELGEAYRRQYGMNVVTLLMANMYGPGADNSLKDGHVIPALINKFTEGIGGVVVWGSGNATRDFLYVDDACDAILQVIATDCDELINVGTGVETRISEVVDTIARLTGFDGEIDYDPMRPDGQPRRVLDVTRARDVLGFEAKTSLEEGLEKTVTAYERMRL